MIARNITDEQAEAAFRVVMEALDKEMVEANNDLAVWLIDGYQAGPLASGAIATVTAGARPYPASTQMGLMQTAIANNIARFLTGQNTANQALENIEADYLVSAREAGLLK